MCPPSFMALKSYHLFTLPNPMCCTFNQQIFSLVPPEFFWLLGMSTFGDESIRSYTLSLIICLSPLPYSVFNLVVGVSLSKPHNDVMYVGRVCGWLDMC